MHHCHQGGWLTVVITTYIHHQRHQFSQPPTWDTVSRYFTQGPPFYIRQGLYRDFALLSPCGLSVSFAILCFCLGPEPLPFWLGGARLSATLLMFVHSAVYQAEAILNYSVQYVQFQVTSGHPYTPGLAIRHSRQNCGPAKYILIRPPSKIQSWEPTFHLSTALKNITI